MPEKGEYIEIELNGKHIIFLFLIIIFTFFVLTSYVNAMLTFRPSMTSAYKPKPPVIILNKAPIADAGLDQNVFVNETVYFDGSGSIDKDGKIVQYLWNFGDGESASGVNVSHAYNSTGKFEAILTVADDDKATDTDKVLINVSMPTLDDLISLIPEESAIILEGLNINSSLEILFELNYTSAANIFPKLSPTKRTKLTEAAIVLGQTDKLSEIILGMETEDATGLLFELDPESGADVVEEMMGINVTNSAYLIENAAESDLKHTVGVLEDVDSDVLVELLIEISGLPSTPSTAAAILESLSFDKAFEVIKAWISIEAYQELGDVFEFLTSDNLNLFYGSLEKAERAVIYTYLSEEVASRILISLLPLPDVTPITLTISKVDSRSYDLSALIENRGNVETNDFGGEFRIGDELTYPFEISNIAVDHSATVSFEWRPVIKGVYPIEVVLDPEGILSEIDKTNNKVVISYGVKLPDLKVDFIDMPLVLKKGKSQDLELEVSNLGEEGATEFNLTMQASGIIIENGQVKWVYIDIGSSVIEELSAGSSKVVEFSWEPTLTGAFSIEAQVDPVEQILDGDRTNNVVKAQIEVERRSMLWLYITIIAVVATAGGAVLYIMRRNLFTSERTKRFYAIFRG